jgi:hypothetical protein
MLANGKVMYHLDLRLVSRSVGNRLADWLAIIEHGMSRRRNYKELLCNVPSNVHRL